MSALSLATLGVQCSDTRALSMATLGVFCGDVVEQPEVQPDGVPGGATSSPWRQQEIERKWRIREQITEEEEILVVLAAFLEMVE